MLNALWVFLILLAPLGAAQPPITETGGSINASIQPVEPISSPDNPPSSSEAPSLQSATKDYESAFIKMIIFLIGLLALVFVVFFVFRKLSSSRMQHSNHFRMIKILEKRAISPKSMLYLIEIGGKKIMLAESQLEIRNISNLEWIETEKKDL